MPKRRIIRKSNKPLNIFVDGGDIQTPSAIDKASALSGNISAVGAGLSNMLGASMQNAQLADASDIENSIDQAQSYVVGANNNEDLLSEWGNYSPLEGVSWSDVRGGSTGQRLGNTLSSIGSGAGAGAAVGGLPGAIIGGVIGLGSAIGGWIAGDTKAKKQADAYNQQIKIANAKNLASLENRAANIDTQNDINAMAAYAADGGKIHIKKKNRGKFTAAAKRAGMGVQEYARHVLANKDRYSSTLVKRANFARNASKWKHADGGPLEWWQYQAPEFIIGKSENDLYDKSSMDNFRDKVIRESSRYDGTSIEDLEPMELRDSLLSNTSGYIDKSRLDRYKTALNNNDYYTALDLGIYNIDKNNNLYFRDVDTNKANEVSSYLKKKGLTKDQYGVIMDNIYRESGFDHTAGRKYKNGEEDYGLFQFTDSKSSDSLSRYRKFLKDKDRKDGIESQIDFFIEEYLPSRPGYEIWNQEDADLNQLSDFMFQKVLSPKKSIRENPQYVERQRRAANRFSNTYADGGSLTHGGNFSNGVTVIGNGGVHEENPFEGVPVGIAPDGMPNLVEEGEVKFNDYIFSNRLFATKDLLSSHNLPTSYANHSFADIAERMSKESSERPNDPISKRGLIDTMTKLQQAQEQLRSERQSRKYAKGGHLFPDGGIQVQNFPSVLNEDEDYLVGMPSPTADTISLRGNRGVEWPSPTTPAQGRDLSWLRYAPAIGSGLGVLSDALGITNKPDYGNADMIGNMANNLTEVDYTPIGNYLTYKPLDRNYYINKLNAQSGATRRAIINQSGGNRATAMAGLLAADYNAQGRLGDLARQAEEYNLAQRERVEAFNRGTNQFNSEMGLRAAIANQANDKLRLQAKTAQAQLRDRADMRSSAGRTANLTNLFDSLGDIGREETARNMISTNNTLYYSIGRDGRIHYKNGYQDLSDIKKESVRAEAARASKRKSNSRLNYITIPNR